MKSKKIFLSACTLMSLLSLLVGSLLFLSCEVYEVAPYEDQIVLEAYLIAGKQFEQIALYRSVGIQELQEMSNTVASNSGNNPFVLSGATVTLFDDTRTFSLVENPTKSGQYSLDSGDSLFVGYNTTYHIQVEALGKVATAETKCPAEVGVFQVEPIGRIVYPDTAVKLLISKPLNAEGFLIIAKSDIDQPFNPVFIGRSDFVTTDTLVTLPWTMFWRFGEVRLYIYAFDKNYHDYLRTHKVGNPTRSLFEPIPSVRGGLGILASASLDSIDIEIETGN